jgi:hypothetical protein
MLIAKLAQTLFLALDRRFWIPPASSRFQYVLIGLVDAERRIGTGSTTRTFCAGARTTYRRSPRPTRRKQSAHWDPDHQVRDRRPATATARSHQPRFGCRYRSGCIQEELKTVFAIYTRGF